MSSPKLCRLCFSSCQANHKIYAENDQGSQLYDLIMEYFHHPKYMDMNMGKYIKVICSVCYQTIWDFHNFQEFIKESQLQLVGWQEETITSIKQENMDEVDNDDDNVNEVTKLSVLQKTDEHEESEKIAIKREPPPDEVYKYSLESERIDENITKDLLCLSNRTTSPMEDIKPVIGQDELQIMDVNTEMDFSSEEDEDNNQINMESINTTQIDYLMAKYIPRIECVYCSDTYPKLRQLRHHIRRTHPDKEFHIVCCSRKLKNHKLIVAHLTLHNNPDAYTCQNCHKSHKDAESFKSHLAKVHGLTMKYQCHMCAKRFADKHGLKVHTRIMHVQDERLEPDILKQDDGSIQYICRQCGKAKPTMKDFRRHRYYTHILKPSRKCEVCGRCYVKMADLEEHMLIHQANTPRDETLCQLFTCIECNKSFHTELKLKRHKWATHPSQQYHCEICNKKLRNKNHYKDHMAAVHEEKELYQCLYCPMRCSTKNAIYCHRRRKHPDVKSKNYYREIHEEPASSTSSYIKGQQTCGVCDRTYISLAKLRHHQRVAHPCRSHRCDDCNASFESIQHLREHIAVVHEKRDLY